MAPIRLFLSGSFSCCSFHFLLFHVSCSSSSCFLFLFPVLLVLFHVLVLLLVLDSFLCLGLARNDCLSSSGPPYVPMQAENINVDKALVYLDRRYTGEFLKWFFQINI